MAKGFSRLVSLIFDRDAAQRMQEETAAALGRAGELGGEELTRALEEGGRTATRALTKALTEEYNKTITDARVKLGKGLIDQKEFDRIKREADASFNAKLIPAMEKLRAEGKITEGEFQALARRIKKVGDEGPKELGRVGSALEAIKGKALAIGAAFVALFALDKVRAFGQAAIQEFLGAEVSVARLNAMVEANGGAVGRTGEQLIQLSKQIQRETFEQADGIELAMSQLLSYHSIVGETFERTMRLGADLSAVFGGLTTSVEGVARALDDPIQGLAMLTKKGFTFDDSVKAQIRSLVEQNRLLEAQDVLLRDLEGQVGGVAAKMKAKSGMAGALDDLSKSYKDLQEEIGGALVAGGNGVSVMEVLTATVRGLTEWVSANRDTISGWVSGGITVATGALKALLFVLRFVTELVGAGFSFALAGATGGLAIFTKGVALAADATAKLNEMLGREDAAKAWRERAAAIHANADALFRYHDAAMAAGRGSLAASVGLGRGVPGAAPGAAETPGAGGGAGGKGGAGSPTVDYLVSEITQLKSLRDLRALTRDESRRLASAEQQLSAMVRAGTLTREEEIKALQALKKERAGLKQELKDEKQLRDELARREERAGAQGRLYNTNAPATGLAGASVIEGRRKGGGSRFGSTIDTGAIGQRADAARNSVLSLDEMGAFEQGFRSVMQNVQDVSADAAHNIASSFQDAFQLMLKEGASIGALFSSIGRAMAGAMLGGLAQYAQGKVKSEIAEAIGMGAKALGFTALGMVPSQAAAAASATKHLAAAAAWGALAGGAGAGRGAITGGAGAIPQNVRDVGLSTYAGAEKKGPEVHIYIDPLSANDPRAQRFVYAANQHAKERFGENANVIVHPYPAGAS